MKPALLAACAALLACNASFDVPIKTAPVEVKLTGEGAMLIATKVQKVSFRAYENVGGDRIRIEERAGVTCTLGNSEFSTAISTPAYVNIPVFGPSPTHIQTSCTFKGETLTEGSLCVRRGEADYCTYANYTFIFGK